MKTNLKFFGLNLLFILLFAADIQAQNQPLFSGKGNGNGLQRKLVVGVGLNPTPTDSALFSADELGLIMGVRFSPRQPWYFNQWQQSGAQARFELEAGLSVPFNTDAFLGVYAGARGLIGTQTIAFGPEIRGYFGRFVVSDTSAGASLPDLNRVTTGSLFIGVSCDVWVFRFKGVDFNFQSGVGRHVNNTGAPWKAYGNVVLTGWF